MGVEKKELASVFDLDDTLFARLWPVRLFSYLKTQATYRKDLATGLDIPDINHGMIESKISPLSWEMACYMAHMGRMPIARMVELIKNDAKENDVYILTGRSSGRDWIEGTRLQLAHADILRLLNKTDRLLFTPGGKHTALSKIHALRQLQELYHGVSMTDDDLNTVHKGATALPDVCWRLVYHGGPFAVYPSERMLTDHPNISVVDLTNR